MACSGCGLSDEAGSGQSGPGHSLYLQSRKSTHSSKFEIRDCRPVVSDISPKAVMKGDYRGVG